MTKKELLQVLATLQVAYPGFYRGMSPDQLEAVKNLWYFHFGAQQYDTVYAAVNMLIATRTETWPPTIGEVNEAIVKMIHDPDALSPMEAWSMVRKALRNSGYHSVEEYEKLPPLVRAALTPEQLTSWAMDPDFNEGVASSNFMRSYQEKRKRSMHTTMLPPNLKRMIDKVADRLTLEGRKNGVEELPVLQGQEGKQVPQQESDL